MAYLKALAMVIWLAISCTAGTLLALVRWKDTNLDRDFGRIVWFGWSRITGIQADIQGAEHLEAHQPCIYAVNHRSELDLFTFSIVYPRRTVVIGKKELLYIPFFGLYFAAAGNIWIDRQKRSHAIAGLEVAVKAVKERGDSIWIFPEGTRNRTKEPLLPFKKGAFYMAKNASVPVIPIVSESIDSLLNWPERRFKSGKLRIRVLPPVYPKDCGNDTQALSAQVRANMEEAIRGLVT